jgi:methyl-accepting chemotaxis protein
MVDIRVYRRFVPNTAWIIRACAVGLVATAVGGVVALFGVGRTEHATDNALEVSVRALEAVDATLLALDAVVSELDDTITGVSTGIEAIANLVDTVSETSNLIATLATDEAVPTINGINDSLDTLIGAADAIEGLLDQVGRLPGIDDLDVPLASSLRDIREGLADLPASLEQLAVQLQSSNTDLLTVRATLVETAATAAEVAEQAREWPALVDEARDVAADAGERLEETRDNVTFNAWLARLGVVATAIAIACANVAGIGAARAWEATRRAGGSEVEAVT